MKIKFDFVTNSSSTSFLCVFRGSTLHNLYKAMKDNWRWFEHEYDDRKVNVYDMIYYEESHDRTTIPIEDKIIEIEKEVKSIKEFVKNNKNNPKYNLEYDEREIQKLEKVIETLKYKKKKGFETTAELVFSNHDSVGSIISYDLENNENNNLVIIRLGYDG